MLEPTKVFSNLRVWHDQTPRTGAENMAVDQLLMESCLDVPILRIYRWSEPTVSFGYFNTLQEATASFPSTSVENLHYVRRWTGGGVVDHRVDVTYTLAIPRNQVIAQTRGAESYRVIHQALADVLGEIGEIAQLTRVCGGDGGVQCFSNPVAYDLTDPSGGKVAGAGQRRSRYGLLHQGSVVPKSKLHELSDALTCLLPVRLAERHDAYLPEPELLGGVAQLAQSRYASREWLEKR